MAHAGPDPGLLSVVVPRPALAGAWMLAFAVFFWAMSEHGRRRSTGDRPQFVARLAGAFFVTFFLAVIAAFLTAAAALLAASPSAHALVV